MPRVGERPIAVLVDERIEFPHERDGGRRDELHLAFLRLHDRTALRRVERTEAVVESRRPCGRVQDDLDGLGLDGGEALPLAFAVGAQFLAHDLGGAVAIDQPP